MVRAATGRSIFTTKRLGLRATTAKRDGMTSCRASSKADLGFELDRNSNFERIRRGDLIGVIGFGSLLSEKSARSTFDTVERFRIGTVQHYRRIFSHVAPIFLERESKHAISSSRKHPTCSLTSHLLVPMHSRSQGNQGDGVPVRRGLRGRIDRGVPLRHQRR